MKTRTLVFMSILIFILAVVVPVLFAGGSKKEELYGTWFNEEYKGNQTAPFERNDWKPDGTFTFYKSEPAVWETDIEVLEGGWIECDSGTYKIEDKWTDSDGNVLYKVEANWGGLENLGMIFHLLMKVSDSNSVLEFMAGRVGYHEEIDPTDVPYTYRIYYRQE